MRAGVGGGRRGRGDASTKAVAAGLLGLQLLGMPVALVARNERVAGGAVLPRLELATAEARGGAALTTEEEMIGERDNSFLPIGRD